MVDHRASSHTDYLQRQAKTNDVRVAEWNKQLTELIKQKNAYLITGQIAETTLTTYANLGTKISTMTQHVPSIRTNLNSSIKIRLTGTTVTKSLDQAHIHGLYAVLVKHYKHAEL
jgi:recombinational DNA repair ATPase RecF